MAVRAAGMSPVGEIPRIRKPGHLFRKLVLLLLLAVAYALGLILLQPKVPWIPWMLFVVFTDAVLALVSGLGTRWLLAAHNWFLRAVVAACLPPVGMALLGYFSDWEIGIDIIALSLGYVSWMDLAQLVGAVLAAWAALWAWHRPARRDMPSATSAEPLRSSQVVQPRRVQSARGWTLGNRLRVGDNAPARAGGGSHARARLITPGVPAPRRARRSLLQRPHVTLALVEEHRCPYCLEPVLRTDSRGVKECEVCHTLHHADCWAITGTCQVPHLNA